MATTWTQTDGTLNAPPETDWRRMTNAAHDHIADRAYQLYEERGKQPGHDVDDWLRAEHEIEERLSAE
jgi:Protein of unknown function (DUF2934)